MNKLVLRPKGVVFDVGNVLIDWNPDYLFRKLIPCADERKWFLTHVCSMSWHAEQDRGRPCAAAACALAPRFPGYEGHIGAFYGRWLETIRGPIDGAVQVLETLKEAGVPVFALSNFPAELWDRTVAAYPFLGLFDDRVLSGEEGVGKPDRRIYDVLIERSGYGPEELVFIDDREENLATAHALGFRCMLFEDGGLLSTDLAEMGLPVFPTPVTGLTPLEGAPA
ncbi:HAD family hydrolase [Lutibaculum baratangense]|uniref:Hydrolase n=1 Tax=Lutibaculum baratangense AMV1 TaxID=631454 RepID=V4R9S7_9HYPH|nr:HAD family phosphatase [Lutibaculum baratangense]ESR22911.1 Hydrolase [Lutibaculum baratangense AMV1]